MTAVLDALDGADLALAPCPDGGFWAVATSAAPAALFRGVRWSCATARTETAAGAKEAGLRVAPDGAAPELADVDTAEVRRRRGMVRATSPHACLTHTHSQDLLAWRAGVGDGHALARTADAALARAALPPPPALRTRLLLFARAKELMGVGEVCLEMPNGEREKERGWRGRGKGRCASRTQTLSLSLPRRHQRGPGARHHGGAPQAGRDSRQGGAGGLAGHRARPRCHPHPTTTRFLASMVLALNQVYVGPSPVPLAAGDEVAVIPPISGG